MDIEGTGHSAYNPVSYTLGLMTAYQSAQYSTDEVNLGSPDQVSTLVFLWPTFLVRINSVLKAYLKCLHTYFY